MTCVSYSASRRVIIYTFLCPSLFLQTPPTATAIAVVVAVAAAVVRLCLPSMTSLNCVSVPITQKNERAPELRLSDVIILNNGLLQLGSGCVVTVAIISNQSRDFPVSTSIEKYFSSKLSPIRRQKLAFPGLRRLPFLVIVTNFKKKMKIVFLKKPAKLDLKI